MEKKLNLSKGGTINLTKRNPGITKYRFGLAWDLKNGRDADLDALAICLGANGKLPSGDIDYIVGYPSGDPGRDGRDKITWTTPTGGLGFKDPAGSVLHHGDLRTGTTTEGDDEVIDVDLARVPATVSEIRLVVSIYTPGTFKDVGVPVVSVYRGETTDVPDLTYALDESFPGSSVVEVASLKRTGLSDWTLEAIGEGVSDLSATIDKYL